MIDRENLAAGSFGFLIVPVGFLWFLSWAAHSTATDLDYTKADIRAMAKHIAHKLPEKINSVVTMSSVKASGRTLIYFYEINNNGVKIEPDQAAALGLIISGKSIAKGCSSPRTRQMVNAGVTTIGMYNDFDGTFLFDVKIDNLTCVLYGMNGKRGNDE